MRQTKRGPKFVLDKIRCPMCGNRFANLIKHLKRNRACKAEMERRLPVIFHGSAEDFLRGG